MSCPTMEPIRRKVLKYSILLRSGLIAGLLTLFLCSASPAQDVKSVSITVSDITASVDFFTEVLNFEEVRRYTLRGEHLVDLYAPGNTTLQGIKVVELRLGQEQIELMEFVGVVGSEIPADSRSNDLWFQHIAIVVSDMEQVYQLLREANVQHVSTAPQTLPDYIPAASGIKAFYFRDPDDHNLEVIYFPEGKGDPRWQSKERLFLGIDHTAIGVRSTEKSQRFYENVVDLKVAGNSENYGSEQEHLNQVFGAHLIITGLRGTGGIGVEFLDYLAPPGGRTFPEGSQVTDLWHWHTTIAVPDIDACFAQAMAMGSTIVSEGIVDIKDKQLPYTRAFMVRDPDGHAIQIINN